MAIKRWEVNVNYLFGMHTRVIVEANTERKAKIKAVEKLKREKGENLFAFATGCTEIIKQK